MTDIERRAICRPVRPALRIDVVIAGSIDVVPRTHDLDRAVT
jgi:hypothetical protein